MDLDARAAVSPTFDSPITAIGTPAVRLMTTAIMPSHIKILPARRMARSCQTGSTPVAISGRISGCSPMSGPARPA